MDIITWETKSITHLISYSSSQNSLIIETTGGAQETQAS